MPSYLIQNIPSGCEWTKLSLALSQLGKMLSPSFVFLTDAVAVIDFEAEICTNACTVCVNNTPLVVTRIKTTQEFVTKKRLHRRGHVPQLSRGRPRRILAKVVQNEFQLSKHAPPFELSPQCHFLAISPPDSLSPSLSEDLESKKMGVPTTTTMPLDEKHWPLLPQKALPQKNAIQRRTRVALPKLESPVHDVPVRSLSSFGNKPNIAFRFKAPLEIDTLERTLYLALGHNDFFVRFLNPIFGFVDFLTRKKRDEALDFLASRDGLVLFKSDQVFKVGNRFQTPSVILYPYKGGESFLPQLRNTLSKCGRILALNVIEFEEKPLRGFEIHFHTEEAKRKWCIQQKFASKRITSYGAIFVVILLPTFFRHEHVKSLFCSSEEIRVKECEGQQISAPRTRICLLKFESEFAAKQACLIRTTCGLTIQCELC